MEFFKCTKEEIDDIAEETYYRTVDDILKMITTFKPLVKIPIKELKILFDAKEDKTINFALYHVYRESALHVILIDKEPLPFKEYSVTGTDSSSIGNIICTRYNEEDQVLNYLMVFDDYFEDSEDGEKGYSLYRDEGFKVSLNPGIYDLRRNLANNRKKAKKYNF